MVISHYVCITNEECLGVTRNSRFFGKHLDILNLKSQKLAEGKTVSLCHLSTIQETVLKRELIFT